MCSHVVFITWQETSSKVLKYSVTSNYMTDDGRSSGIPPKPRYLSIKSHVVTIQKILIFKLLRYRLTRY
jgi:hypothetical protein